MKTAKLAKMFASMYFTNHDEGYTRLRSYTDPSKNPSPVRIFLTASMYWLNGFNWIVFVWGIHCIWRRWRKLQISLLSHGNVEV